MTRKQIIKLFLSHVAKQPGINGCWLWKPCEGRDEYGKLYGIPEGGFAHRVSYSLFVGAIDGADVLHKCPNGSTRACVRPDHLYRGTDKDNAADRDREGRTVKGDKHWTRTNPEKLLSGADHPRHRLSPTLWPRGERVNTAKMTREGVWKLRRDWESGEYAQKIELAHKYGISNAQVCAIIHRRSWRHVA